MFFGQNVVIERNVVVGHNVKIQNNVSVFRRYTGRRRVLRPIYGVYECGHS